MTRTYDGGRVETGRSPRVANAPPFKRKSKGRKKLGGGGLSLEAFVAAKSKSQINPAQIREHREFYQNAKKVQKYRKLVRQLGGEVAGDTQRVEVSENEPDGERDAMAAKGEGGVLQNKSSAKYGRKKLAIAKTDGKDFKIQRKSQMQQRPTSQIEKMRVEYEKEKLDKEEKKREREALYVEQQETREKARRVRNEVKSRLRKKTQRGQPVMKHRMELLLETIERGS